MEKNGSKINRDKSQLLKIKFRNKVDGNRSDHDVRFKVKLIDKVKTFDYSRSIVQENRGDLLRM